MPQEKYAYNQRKKIKNSYRNHKITPKTEIYRNHNIHRNHEIFTKYTEKHYIHIYTQKLGRVYIHNLGRVYTRQFGTRIHTPIRDAYTHILHGLYLNK